MNAFPFLTSGRNTSILFSDTSPIQSANNKKSLEITHRCNCSISTAQMIKNSENKHQEDYRYPKERRISTPTSQHHLRTQLRRTSKKLHKTRYTRDFKARKLIFVLEKDGYCQSILCSTTTATRRGNTVHQGVRREGNKAGGRAQHII